jgi:hypothetical protein
MKSDLVKAVGSWETPTPPVGLDQAFAVLTLAFELHHSLLGRGAASTSSGRVPVFYPPDSGSLHWVHVHTHPHAML